MNTVHSQRFAIKRISFRFWLLSLCSIGVWIVVFLQIPTIYECYAVATMLSMIIGMVGLEIREGFDMNNLYQGIGIGAFAAILMLYAQVNEELLLAFSIGMVPQLIGFLIDLVT